MKMDKKKLRSQIIIYKTESGETKIDVRFEDETVWLSQGQIYTNPTEHQVSNSLVRQR